MNSVTIENEQVVENLIYEINGKQIMLDSDLAKLYNVETKRINEAVKNNPMKFPERYSWKLTDDESKNFLVEIFDQKIETRGGKYKNPRVFTEQGVMMLATILKSNIATEVTIRIMDAFVLMKKYISSDLIKQKYINDLVLEDHDKIKALESSLQKLEEKKKVNEIYFDGQIYDAYFKIQEIFNYSKNKLIIVDAYADNTILNIIKRLKIEVIIITKPNNLITEQDVFKYNKQYHNLKVIFNNQFHDRYIIIDDREIYHCGTSINRIGYKTFSINLIGDKEVQKILLEKIYNIIKIRNEV